MDNNALIVQFMLDRQSELAELRAALTAAETEIQRLGQVAAARDLQT